MEETCDKSSLEEYEAIAANENTDFLDQEGKIDTERPDKPIKTIEFFYLKWWRHALGSGESCD